jgi:GDPmannose 4,6-dehydratase
VQKALITGITGQDGSYLADLLLEKGYEVHGMVRRSSSIHRDRVDPLLFSPHGDRLHLHYGDMTDGVSLNWLVATVRPDEVYNLAAQSHVKVSFEMPEFAATADGLGAMRLLEAIRLAGLTDCRYFQATSSEIFGISPPPQSEMTRYYPRSPYATAKLFAHCSTVNYREAYDMYAVSGILFNHESPRRGESFVTRKITRAVAHIQRGLTDRLVLGNVDAVRDWGYAKEYVEAIWLMLQQDTPDDFVLATGVGTTVRDFARMAFEHVGLDWEQYTQYDKRYERPTEVHDVIGDPSKADRELGWRAETKIEGLAQLMVEADLDLLDRPIEHSFERQW